MKVPPLQAVNIKVFFSKNTFLEVHSSSYLKLSANNNVPVSETGSSDCQRFVFIGDEGECGHDDPLQVWQTSPAMKWTKNAFGTSRPVFRVFKIFLSKHSCICAHKLHVHGHVPSNPPILLTRPRLQESFSLTVLVFYSPILVKQRARFPFVSESCRGWITVYLQPVVALFYYVRVDLVAGSVTVLYPLSLTRRWPIATITLAEPCSLLYISIFIHWHTAIISMPMSVRHTNGKMKAGKI